MVVLLLMIGGFALYTWATLTWSFSKGDRTGYVQKLSKRAGYAKHGRANSQWSLCLGRCLRSSRSACGAMLLQSGSTVRQESVVVLLYEQHRGIPFGCFGETEYFITNVRIIE